MLYEAFILNVFVFLYNVMYLSLPCAALSSCAHVQELTRTKQGQFTLEDHVLKEERWTYQDISQSLQPCPKPVSQQNNNKKGKPQGKPAQPGSESAGRGHNHDSPEGASGDRND